MKFNHLNVPDSWKHYWTRYPEGYTVLEALISWVSQVDSMVDNVNSWNDYLDNFVASFDKELQKTVTDTLSDWQDSGFIDVVISEALQWQLDDYIATNDQRLDDNAISPDDFEGTDQQKVQQALDYGLENNVAVRFARMYDITGHTLMINRPQLYYATDRKQLFLIGAGGGIKKNDSGYIFDAEFNATGDINVSGIKFESVEGVGTIVFNGGKIIRIKCQNNQYRNVDTILSAPTHLTQTTYFVNEHITGGKGWKFESRRFLDLLIDGCIIEDIEHFIRNTEALTIAMNNTVRIINNLIENLSGKTALLGGSYGLIFDNNYMEFNNEYLDFHTLATNYPHIGLSINHNTFYLTDAQRLAGMPCIKIKNVNASSIYGSGGVNSSGNSVAGGVLYDLTDLGANEFVIGSGDFGEIINPNKYISNGKPYLESLADGFTVRSHGTAKVYYKQFTLTLVPSNSEEILTIDTAFDLKPFMTVDVLVASEWFVVTKKVVDDVNNKIKITFKNTHPESALNVLPRVIVEELYMV